MGTGITISGSLTSGEEIPELKIHCKLCDRKYHFIGFTDPDYLMTHVKYSDVALKNLKHHFPRIRNPFSILMDNLGIARLEKRWQKVSTSG